MNRVVDKAIEHFGSGLSVVVLALVAMVYLYPDTTWTTKAYDGWHNKILYFLFVRLSNFIENFLFPIAAITLIVVALAVVLYLHDLLNLHRGLKYLGFGVSFPALYLAIYAYQYPERGLGMSDRSGVWYQDMGTFLLIDLPTVIMSFWFLVIVTTVILASTIFCLRLLIKGIADQFKSNE